MSHDDEPPGTMLARNPPPSVGEQMFVLDLLDSLRREKFEDFELTSFSRVLGSVAFGRYIDAIWGKGHAKAALVQSRLLVRLLQPPP
jgi:hypothetical protein